jgi:diguanylate cyclase (GGDEF)-like protein
MELLLGRWSTGAQVTSAVVLAVFFALLLRATQRPELRWWVRAWGANCVALFVTLLYWLELVPDGFQRLLSAVYLAAKTAFALYLLQGTWALARPGVPSLRDGWRRGIIVAYAIAGAVTFDTVNQLGAGQHLPLGILFAVATGILLRERRRGCAWLAAGLGARALLALAEGSAYFARALPPGTLSAGTEERVGLFLASHSAFDSASEWLLALGCVLALWDRAERELRSTNQELLVAQEDLRRLVDRDPLTGLANRRSLPAVFRAAYGSGAMLLFFDLDDFKLVNDTFGHRVGDACLRRVADALRECFRPEDAIVRYGGDEFLVVAAGMDEAMAIERAEAVRARLAALAPHAPALAFSVGVQRLEPSGDADAAVQAADEAMYRAKHATALGLGGLP